MPPAGRSSTYRCTHTHTHTQAGRTSTTQRADDGIYADETESHQRAVKH